MFEDKINNIFISGSGKKYESKDVLEEISRFFKDERGVCVGKLFQDYKMVIGTDSEDSGEHTDFVMVVALWKKGRGGRYFYQRQKTKKFTSFNPRVFQEASFSINLARYLLNAAPKHLSGEFIRHNLEIHLDIGDEDGKNGTASMVRGIVGMVRGYGFDNVKIKPEAYGAATIADRHC